MYLKTFMKWLCVAFWMFTALNLLSFENTKNQATSTNIFQFYDLIVNLTMTVLLTWLWCGGFKQKQRTWLYYAWCCIFALNYIIFITAVIVGISEATSSALAAGLRTAGTNDYSGPSSRSGRSPRSGSRGEDFGAGPGRSSSRSGRDFGSRGSTDTTPNFGSSSGPSPLAIFGGNSPAEQFETFSALFAGAIVALIITIFLCICLCCVCGCGFNTWMLGIFGSLVNEGVREEDQVTMMHTDASNNE
jgi:hypothetical protein